MKFDIYTPKTRRLILPLLLVLAIGNAQTIIAQQNPSADAGEDFTACENAVFLDGSAQNYETVFWSTTGDGTFDQPESLSTQYFPGSNDLSAETFEACLTAYAGDEQASDCVTVSLVRAPVVNLNVDTVEICYFESYTFENTEISNYSVIQWFTTNGSGAFDNETIPNPTYTPSPTVDYAQGCVEIIVLAQGIDPCEIYAEDLMNLCFVPNPQVDLGGDIQNACIGENYTFTQATASGTSSIQWFPLTGAGYFENPNSINATYVPNPEFDYPQGCVFLGVTIEPISPCTGNLEEYVQLCFADAPEVNAGDDATILFNDTFSPAPTVSNQDEVLWETSGDGTFDDSSQLSPNYSPGIMDMQTGSANLTITAFTNGCSSVFDELLLTIITEQQIDIPQGLGAFSTYINTSGLSFEDIIAPIADDVIFAQNGSKIYWPEYDINTFDDFSGHLSFKLRTDNAVTLTLSGTLNELTVDLPAGWSLLPVPVFCNINTQELVDQLGTDLIIVSEIDGSSLLWPEGGLNTLTELVPGKAYNIKLANPGQIVFPACD